MRTRASFRALGGLCIVGAGLFGCVDPANAALTTTLVGLGSGTLVKTSGLVDTSHQCNPASPAAPNVQGWWNGMPAANRQFPFVGLELWRNTTDGCLESRIDAYRALVTFNMASVRALRGLVTKAELVVMTRALPSGVSAGNPACVAITGGAGSLVRFGPAAAANLPPVSGGGTLTMLPPPTPFPVGNLVYNFPRPWSAGNVPGAANPTTTTASGNGGAVFTTDVTNQVVAALNGGFAGTSWMLVSASEGPLTGPAPRGLDCKTSYTFKLQLTHL